MNEAVSPQPESQKKNHFYPYIIVGSILFWLLPLGYWTSNEETYLGLAWRRFNPEPLSALVDQAHHRFLFEFLTGFSINYLLGFEITHALGRLVVVVFYTYALVQFFQALKLSLMNACLILLVFLGLGQDILGQEALFAGIEPKCLAYPCVFLGFTGIFRQRFYPVIFWLSLATYFHFLIGIFWFVFALFFQWIHQRNLSRLIRQFGIYSLIIVPLLIIIFLSQLAPVTNEFLSSPSVDWIYSSFRAPHHTDPFVNPVQFKQWYDNGIVFLIGLTSIVTIFYKQTDYLEKKAFRWLLFLYSYLWIALLITYFDQGSVLGKFYLFRPSSLILFFTLCFIVQYIQVQRIQKTELIQLTIIILMVSLILPTTITHILIYERIEAIFTQKAPIHSAWRIAKDIFYNYEDTHVYYHFSGKVTSLISRTPKTEIFLIDPQLEAEQKYLSFERRFNRPTLVTYKFVPTSPNEIKRWYFLQQQKQQLFTKGCPAKIIQDYNIHYLVTHLENNQVNNCGKIIYRRGFKLIKINSNKTVEQSNK